METVAADVLVIGGGAAAAKAAIEARAQGVHVLLVDKSIFGKSGSSTIAGGGLTVPVGHVDNEFEPVEKLFEDTVIAGAYLNNQKLVRILVNESVQRVLQLEQFGILFKRQQDGKKLVLGQSGGHRYRRIAYAFFPDQFGKLLMQSLKSEIIRHGIPFLEDTFITSILVNKGTAIGAVGLDLRTSHFTFCRAKSIVLATGGAGQLYGFGTVSANTTNPIQNTGDGMAMALRIGGELLDMEMVQYMPMSFVYPSILKGVVVGEPGLESNVAKARLVNKYGERFMERYDADRLERSTRDVASRAILTEIHAGRGTDHGGVYFDHSAGLRSEEYARQRPYKFRLFRDYCNIDPTKQLVEGAPSVHYMMGGIKINEKCETNISGLYAAGEVTGGIHGANRLGGNSLTDTQVFGARAGYFAANRALTSDYLEYDEDQIEEEKDRIASLIKPGSHGIRPHEIRRRIQEQCWEHVGVFRDREGLELAIAEFERIRKEELPQMRVAFKGTRYNFELVEAIETYNMLDVAEAIARSALLRTESRGAHCRTDYPHKNDEKWLKNILVTKDDEKFILRKLPAVITELEP